MSPDVPALIDRICSWKPKILVILRDPIERAYSHYRMEREKLRVKDDFETVIRNEIDYMVVQVVNKQKVVANFGSTCNKEKHLT